MQLDPNETSSVVNRLVRAHRELAGVVRMLEEGRGCEDIVTQLAGVSRALDKAGFAIIATSMKQCLAESGGSESADVVRFEKLFLSLG